MADEWKNIFDYYQPPTTSELLGIMATKESLENRKIQNRLAAMKEQDEKDERERTAATYEMYRNQFGANPASNAAVGPAAGTGAAAPTWGASTAAVGGSNPLGNAAASTNQPLPNGGIQGTIAAKAQQAGVDPRTALAMADEESGFKNVPNPHSSAKGIFQMIDGTWRAMGGTPANRQDVTAQVDLGIKNLAATQSGLKERLGRTPTPQEIFLGQWQGVGGFMKIMNNPNARAGDLFGDDSIKANGGNPNMTAKEYADIGLKRFNRFAEKYGAGAGNLLNYGEGLMGQAKTDGAQATPKSSLPGWASTAAGVDGGANQGSSGMVADASGKTVPTPTGFGAPAVDKGNLGAFSGSRGVLGTGLTREDIAKLDMTKPHDQAVITELQRRSVEQAKSVAPEIEKAVQYFLTNRDTGGLHKYVDTVTEAYRDNSAIQEKLAPWKNVTLSPKGADYDGKVEDLFALFPQAATMMNKEQRDAITDPKNKGKNIHIKVGSDGIESVKLSEPDEDKNTRATTTTGLDIQGAKEKFKTDNPTSEQVAQYAREQKMLDKKAEAEAKDAGIDIKGLADRMGDGDLATYQATGSMGNPVKTKIQSEVLKKYPKFDFVKLDSNAKWDMNPTNQRTQSMIMAALPRVSSLADQVKSLGNTDIPIANRVKQFTETELGGADYTNFNSNRNAIVQEINTALSGSSTSSDMRINIELENINSARSPAQLHGAINNLNEALLSRLDSSKSPLWPKEVVQGRKSPEEYTKSIISKYRGRFGDEADKAKDQNHHTTADSLDSAKPGDKATANGKTYILQEDGKTWLPQK